MASSQVPEKSPDSPQPSMPNAHRVHTAALRHRPAKGFTVAYSNVSVNGGVNERESGHAADDSSDSSWVSL